MAHLGNVGSAGLIIISGTAPVGGASLPQPRRVVLNGYQSTQIMPAAYAEGERSPDPANVGAVSGNIVASVAVVAPVTMVGVVDND